MECTFLEFLRYDYPSLLLVLGLVVLRLSNRKNKLPAVFTLWIMTFIMKFSLFVEFVCKWSENDPSLADIRYWTTIIKYLISPTMLMMQIMVLIKATPHNSRRAPRIVRCCLKEPLIHSRLTAEPPNESVVPTIKGGREI